MTIVASSGEMPLKNEHDISARAAGGAPSRQDQGFLLVDQTKLVTAASELARNALIYGGGGEMEMGTLIDGAKRGVNWCFRTWVRESATSSGR